MAQDDDRYGPGNTQNQGTGQQPPQFGQRSENWQQPQAPKQESPWPVYSPGSTATPPQNFPQQPPVPTFGGPAPGVPAPQGYPGGGVPPQLPGRGWPIFTLVLGVVMAVLIAPGVLFGMVLSGINFESIADGSINTFNGGQVQVDDTGTVALLPQNQSSMNSCVLTGDGGEYEIFAEADTGIVVGRNITPGAYTLDCDAPEGLALFAFNGDDISGIISKAMAGMLWSSVIGVLGVVVAITGIVWLVRRNGQRKEIMRTMWVQSGPPR